MNDKISFNREISLSSGVAHTGADLGFSRGAGGRIFKKKSKILTIFFLGQPN